MTKRSLEKSSLDMDTCGFYRRDICLYPPCNARLSACQQRPFRALILSLIVSIFILSCGPTYPAQEVSESIIKLCKKEYNLEVQPRIIDSALWVYLPLDYLLDSSLQLAPEVAEKIEHVLFCVHRVVLSTDRRIDFYALCASDIKDIGADFTLIGYIPDIKKSRLLDISREEYYQRVLRDLSLNPKALHDKEGRHIQFKKISLPRFLAEQVSQRIKMKIKKIKEVEWRFEDRIFKFEVEVSTVSPQKRNEITKKITDEAKHILQEYEFKDYSGIQISF